jgi:hypothetical protein
MGVIEFVDLLDLVQSSTNRDPQGVHDQTFEARPTPIDRRLGRTASLRDRVDRDRVRPASLEQLKGSSQDLVVGRRTPRPADTPLISRGHVDRRRFPSLHLHKVPMAVDGSRWRTPGNPGPLRTRRSRLNGKSALLRPSIVTRLRSPGCVGRELAKEGGDGAAAAYGPTVSASACGLVAASAIARRARAPASQTDSLGRSRHRDRRAMRAAPPSLLLPR